MRRIDRIVIQGTGSLFLVWAEVARAMESEITLNGQKGVKEFEDRVVAMNKAGEGEGKRRPPAVLEE